MTAIPIPENDRQADAGNGGRRIEHMISVAMTTCNGLPYVREQIDSILPQLGPDDELVISDDGSTDGTRKLIDDLAWQDKRVQVVEGPRTGLIDNFANALRACKGDFVFLSDHDDVWLPDKISQVMAVFDLNHDVILVQHNARFANEDLAPQALTTFAWRHSRAGLGANLLRNRYQGCAMAFRHELVYQALPFPANIPMHDQWLGMMAEMTGRVCFYDEVLMLYRRHASNLSGTIHSSWRQMAEWRRTLFRELMKRRRSLRERARTQKPNQTD